VASEDTEAIIDSLNILNAQKQMAADGAASGNTKTKGVVVDSKSGKKAKAVSPTLTSNENSRLEKVFKILKKVINPDPEAGKSSTSSRATEKEQTGSSAPVPTTQAPKDGSSLLKKLGLAALLASISAFIAEFSGPIIEFAVKAVAKVKAWIKILKPIAKTLFRAVKAIGTFFTESKFGSRVIKFIKGVKGVGEFFGNIGTNIAKFASSVVDFLKPAGPDAVKIGKGAKGALMASKVGLKFLKFLRFLPVIGGLVSFGFAFVKFKNGDNVGGMLELLSGVLNLIPLGFTNIASALIDGYILYRDFQLAKPGNTPDNVDGNILDSITGFISNKLIPVLRYVPGIGGIIQLGEAVGKFAGGDMIGGFRDLYGGLFGLVGGKGLGDAVDSGFDFIVGMFDSDAIDSPAANKGSTFKDFTSNIWQAVKDKVKKFGTKVKDYVIDTIPFARDLLGDTEAAEDNEASSGNAGVNIVKKVAKAGFNMSPIGLAAKAGSAIADFFMNDGILTHGGQKVRINSKDDVLALKTGGPLDKLLNPSTLDIGSAQVFDDMRELGKAQLQTLVAIKNGINALVAKGGQSTSGLMEINLKQNKLTNAFRKNEQYP